MSIQFKPRKSDDTYVFGGTDTDPNSLTNTKGVAGPFPRYNIGREIVRQDSVVINQRFNISITGVALITSAASMLQEGKRQEQVQKLMKLLLENDARLGLLEIVPYGGLSDEKLSFPDARLLSIDLPEADEGSAGVQNQGYTVTFEANQIITGNGEYEQEDDIEGVIDVQESWDVSINDNVYGQERPDLKDTAYQYRTFNVSHSISATGFDTYTPAVSESEEGAGDGTSETATRGWEHARDFVEGRLLTNVRSGDSIPRDMNPLTMNDQYTKGKGIVVGVAAAGGNDEIRPLGNGGEVTALGLPVKDTTAEAFPEPAEEGEDPPCGKGAGTAESSEGEGDGGKYPEGEWQAYNLVRQKTYDIAAGSYSVSSNWTIGRFAATHSIEFSFTGDSTAEFNTVDVSVTVQGMEGLLTPKYVGVYNGRIDMAKTKYQNAKASFKTLQARIGQAARCFYNENKVRWGTPDADDATGAKKLLRSVARSSSESHNELDGVITYNVSYDDTKVCDPNVLDESINLTYSNLDGGNQIIVLHPIIARADGPIIQDMSTTNERTLSISIDRTMVKAARTAKPNGMDTALLYVPQGVDEDGEASGTVAEHVYRRSHTESWNPKNGQYNLSVEYVWAELITLAFSGPPACEDEEEEEEEGGGLS